MGSELLTLQSVSEGFEKASIKFKSSSGRISILVSDFSKDDPSNWHLSCHLHRNQVELLVQHLVHWLGNTIHHDLPRCDDKITEEEASKILYNLFYQS